MRARSFTPVLSLAQPFRTISCDLRARRASEKLRSGGFLLPEALLSGLSVMSREEKMLEAKRMIVTGSMRSYGDSVANLQWFSALSTSEIEAQPLQTSLNTDC